MSTVLNSASVTSVSTGSNVFTINNASDSLLTVDAVGAIQWSPSASSQLSSSYGNSVSIENGYYGGVNNSANSSGGGYAQGTITNYPSYPWPATQPLATPLPKDELKSAPKEASPMAHTLNGVMRIYGDSVVIEYFCAHCNQVLHTEVISKVPKSIIEEKCLPKIVDGVK